MKSLEKTVPRFRRYVDYTRKLLTRFFDRFKSVLNNLYRGLHDFTCLTQLDWVQHSVFNGRHRLEVWMAGVGVSTWRTWGLAINEKRIPGTTPELVSIQSGSIIHA